MLKSYWWWWPTGFYCQSGPFGFNWVLKLIGTWLWLGLGILGLRVWGQVLTIDIKNASMENSPKIVSRNRPSSANESDVSVFFCVSKKENQELSQRRTHRAE